jgi:hypothetical protein
MIADDHVVVLGADHLLDRNERVAVRFARITCARDEVDVDGRAGVPEQRGVKSLPSVEHIAPCAAFQGIVIAAAAQDVGAAAAEEEVVPPPSSVSLMMSDNGLSPIA